MDNNPKIAQTSLRDFFALLVERALNQQRLELKEQTTQYLVNLLYDFSRSEELHSSNSETLASLYLQSSQSSSASERMLMLKRVGDVALYVSGFFSDSLNRKLVDVDYYITMGGTAYNDLTNIVRSAEYAALYAEMAAKFYRLVDLLSQISEEREMTSNEDILRLYERWQRTGSRHLYSKLVAQGVVPLETKNNDKKN